MMHGEEFRELGFRKTYETLYPLLYRVIYRITGRQQTAEDLCQEAFIRFYESDVAILDLEQAKYWLLRVSKNLALNHEKRRNRERKAYEKLRDAMVPYYESGELELLKSEESSRVQEALSRLPINLRTVIVLREYAGLSYREIGALVGVTEGNVKVRMFRARKALAAALGEWMGGRNPASAGERLQEGGHGS